MDCTQCHRANFINWDFRHQALSSGCSSCHLNSSNPPKPASHTTNGWVTCEQCHRSTSSWIFTHPTAGSSGCSGCHLNMSNPPKPANHAANGWVTCEQCHKSTSTWSFTHPLTSFPLNHKGTSPGDCAACHPGGAYNNSGGCIECHRAEGEEVHKTTLNSGCLGCHPTGN